MNTITSEVKTSRDGKTRTTIVTINGKSFQRKSPRTYTFAIAVKPTLSFSEAKVEAILTDKNIVRDCEWSIGSAKARIAGDVEYYVRNGWRRDTAENMIAEGNKYGDLDKEKAFLATEPTVEKLVAKRYAEAKKHLAERVAAGDYTLGVRSWSQSRANAEKASNALRTSKWERFDEVVVIEVKDESAAA